MTPTASDIAALAPLKEMLLERCGLLFALDNRQRSLVEAVAKRMKECQLSSHGAYLLLLQRDLDEFQCLVDLLTVNETYFFREPDHLNLAVNSLVPALLACGRNRPVKIVCAGCSSGEEPYSLAIMLYERFGENSRQLFSLIGFDIDATVIAIARNATYGRSSFRTLPEELKQRYFSPLSDHTYALGDVKQLVSFEVVNLLASNYPDLLQDADIIFYRNVSIYFPSHVQREIFRKLAGLLVEGGALFVSATETLYHDLGILPLVTEEAVFFFRKIPEIMIEERRNASRDQPERQRPPTVAPAVLKRNPAPARNVAPLRAAVPLPSRPSAVVAPDDPKLLFDQALSYAHEGKHEQALSALDTLLASHSAFTKAACLKASLLMNDSRFLEASQVCRQTLQHDPLALEAYLILGMVARHEGDETQAHQRFREAIYLNSSCWFAHYYLGEILFLQGDHRRARQEFEITVNILTASGSTVDHGHEYFPLTFNAGQFVVIARHKLSLLKEHP